MVLAEGGDLDSLGMAAPLVAVRGGENVTIFDVDGRGWQSLRGRYQLSTRAPNLRPLPGESTGYERHADALPSTQALG